MVRPSLLLLLALALAPAALPRVTAADDRVLTVGVADGPPFAMRGDDGNWTGLGVELWQAVAADLGWHYEFRQLDLGGLRAALAAGSVDAAIGVIPVTAENDKFCDFSQPYLTTGLGLAQRATDPMTVRSVLGILLDRRLLSILGIVVVAIVAVGVLIALLERRTQGADFGGPLRESVSTGVWWAAVTMTTVGYGDATPKSAPGRLLALVWMFIGVVVIAILTATVTSSLTVSHLRGVVDQPSDLLRLRLGVVPGGAGEEFLQRRQAHFATFPTYEAALTALAESQIDAFVANKPTLRYLVHHHWQGVLQVSPLVLEPESFAIALPDDSALRKPLDSAVIRARQSEQWHDVLHTHLGPSAD